MSTIEPKTNQEQTSETDDQEVEKAGAQKWRVRFRSSLRAGAIPHDNSGDLGFTAVTRPSLKGG